MKTVALLEGKKHIHMIGIGGSGMFPIARILHDWGYYITGSDNNPSDTLTLVQEMGIPVTLGQRAENIQGADLIIHTAAIMADNEELIAARQSGVPVLERSEILGMITECYQETVCISGTHGKTTTTAMLTQILLDAGLDPTAVIGGKLPAIGGNGRVGHTERMVCEACEFVDTFLHLSPDISLILNIDEDHMDYFKTMDRLRDSFRRFAEKTSRLLIVNGEDENVKLALSGLSKETVTFGFSPDNDFYPTDLQPCGIGTAFTLMERGKALGRLEVKVPGRHNVLNGVAAAVAALQVGADFPQVQAGLAAFHGAGRRFEVLGEVGGITVADDYAHHPAELEVTLRAAKEMPFKRVIAVHQPFTYSRTKLHLEAFARVLAIADEVVLSEIMGSREKNTIGIYASHLADRIPGCRWFPDFAGIAQYVCEIAKPGDLIITLGCGDIYKAAKLILAGLQ